MDNIIDRLSGTPITVPLPILVTSHRSKKIMGRIIIDTKSISTIDDFVSILYDYCTSAKLNGTLRIMLHGNLPSVCHHDTYSIQLRIDKYDTNITTILRTIIDVLISSKEYYNSIVGIQLDGNDMILIYLSSDNVPLYIDIRDVVRNDGIDVNYNCNKSTARRHLIF